MVTGILTWSFNAKVSSFFEKLRNAFPEMFPLESIRVLRITTVSSIYLGELVPEIRPTSNKMQTTVEASTTDFEYNHKYRINADFT